MTQIFSSEYFMKEALKEAIKAFEKDEVPVGAVVVSNQKIISRSHNQTQLLNDATAHAEMIAITAASSALNSRYLEKCQIYVTLEPCLMCMSALWWSGIETVYYGAKDPKRGFSVFSAYPLRQNQSVHSGVLAEDCEQLLRQFFQKKREK